jgi:epoxyqueuosine reductase QueG
LAKSQYRPFTPKPEQVALMPSASGNAINGLGEAEVRRPTYVYWHEPDTLHHGEMQKWFYTQNMDHPAIQKVRADREVIHAIEVPPVSGEPMQQAPEEWTEQLAAHAATLDFELFGVTAFNPEWSYEGIEIKRKWAIMIGVAHDYEQINKAPDNEAGAEVIKQYGRACKASKDVATWIQERGWEADPYFGPWSGSFLMIPHAIECGFGELGKHGSIINKNYGSSFRLSAVLTDLPLLPTPRVSYDVDDFCSRCQVCSNACPPDAIMPEKVMVRGEMKWYVDFDKCIPFFNEHAGCAICIAVCPWSIPGRGPRIVEQLQRRAARQKESV